MNTHMLIEIYHLKKYIIYILCYMCVCVRTCVPMVLHVCMHMCRYACARVYLFNDTICKQNQRDIVLHIPWKSKTKQRMVFPTTKEQSLVFGLPWYTWYYLQVCVSVCIYMFTCSCTLRKSNWIRYHRHHQTYPASMCASACAYSNIDVCAVFK